MVPPRYVEDESELYGALVEVAFPLLVIHVELLFAVPARVQFAADESDDKFSLFVHDFFATAAWDVDAVGVEEVLGDECELG